MNKGKKTTATEHFQKSNWKIIETGINTSNTHLYMTTSLGTSIKSYRVELLSWVQTSPLCEKNVVM